MLLRDAFWWVKRDVGMCSQPNAGTDVIAHCSAHAVPVPLAHLSLADATADGGTQRASNSRSDQCPVVSLDVPSLADSFCRPEHAAIGCAVYVSDQAAISGAKPRPDSGAVRQPNALPVESSTVLDAAAEPAPDERSVARSELGAFGESQHGTVAAAQLNAHNDTFSRADSCSECCAI